MTEVVGNGWWLVGEKEDFFFRGKNRGYFQCFKQTLVFFFKKKKYIYIVSCNKILDKNSKNTLFIPIWNINICFRPRISRTDIAKEIAKVGDTVTND